MFSAIRSAVTRRSKHFVAPVGEETDIGDHRWRVMSLNRDGSPHWEIVGPRRKDAEDAASAEADQNGGPPGFDALLEEEHAAIKRRRDAEDAASAKVDQDAGPPDIDALLGEAYAAIKRQRDALKDLQFLAATKGRTRWADQFGREITELKTEMEELEKVASGPLGTHGGGRRRRRRTRRGARLGRVRTLRRRRPPTTARRPCPRPKTTARRRR